MKRIGIVFLVSLFLYSCGWSEEKAAGLQKVDTAQYSISIPENWVVLENTSEYNPKSWELSFAATSGDIKYWFLNNILILSQDTQKLVSSNDYSILNNVGTSREALEYVRLDSKNIDFSDTDSTTVYVFEAKYNLQTPTLKFVQFGKVCKSTQAHLVTIAVAQDTKNMDPYIEFAKTFSCK